MLKYIFLGAVQGLTEFFPVSSSGHLLILQHLLGLSEDWLAISIVLHLGTACALVVFFLRDIIELLSNLRLFLLLALVTLITGIIGLAGRSFFEGLFSSAGRVAFAFMLTGIMLIFTKGFLLGERSNFNLKDALILGIMQSIAIIPGVSRSGITISTLLFRGLKKENGLRLSFLAAVPVIFAAAFLESRRIDFALKENWLGLVLGFLASFSCGIIALKLLRMILKKAKFHYFGYYCIVLAIVVFLFIR
ncbi:MAG: undecaprenyl-diphosphate phosphatase [Candidatus Omnitrophica bacterium]|nr:undecaprenyl-diphosphate phosphatase [Candidatus Omnitrophota bacterium]